MVPAVHLLSCPQLRAWPPLLSAHPSPHPLPATPSGTLLPTLPRAPRGHSHLTLLPTLIPPPACDHHPVTVLTAIPGKLYGRGATDDKGPVAGWINALEAFQKTKQVRGPRPATPFTCPTWWCAVGLSVPGTAVKIKDHTPHPTPTERDQQSGATFRFIACFLVLGNTEDAVVYGCSKVTLLVTHQGPSQQGR